MAQAPDQPLPPYSSFKTFENFTNVLAAGELPHRIDKSLLPKLSGGAQSSLLGALRYLNFTDENNRPTTALTEYIKAGETDRPAILKPIVTTAYAFVFTDGFELHRATAAQLSEKFRTQKVSGSTLQKSIALFLALAKAAGIAISQHIEQNKHAGNTGAPKKPKVTKPPTNGTGTADTPPPAPPGGTSNATLADKLLAKFPELDPKWDDATKSKWFDAFDRLMSSAGIAPKEP